MEYMKSIFCPPHTYFILQNNQSVVVFTEKLNSDLFEFMLRILVLWHSAVVTAYTHPDFSDRLRGSHIKQYRCDYCKLGVAVRVHSWGLLKYDLGREVPLRLEK